MSLKIEYLPISVLTPYENNAKKHKDLDIGAIVSSIEEFGFDDPVGIWGDKNIIVEGHGRVMAAKKIGMTEVPCIRLDHLTDEQRKAYTLAHNKTAELSSWDDDLLQEELDALGRGLEEFGFGWALGEDNTRFATTEFDLGSFDDEAFDYECEDCGFKFNA